MGTQAKLNTSIISNYRYRAVSHVAILTLIYVIVLFLLPASKQTMQAYNFSAFEYRIMTLAIALPSMIVWLMSFIGYTTLNQYSKSIPDSSDSKHYSLLAKGCGWLAWSLPITALASLTLNGIAYKYTSLHPFASIFNNYLNLVLPLVAFSIIGKASRGLVSDAKLKLSLSSARSIILVFLAAGVFYCYLTFTHFDLHNIGSTANPYYLPIWLMVISIIIPYLYAWFIGLLAAYEITLYSKQVAGLFYKVALRYLASGLVTIVVSSIVLQYVNGVSPRVGHLLLNYQLIITVLFKLVGGAGFILLTIGALKLKRIEEV